MNGLKGEMERLVAELDKKDEEGEEGKEEKEGKEGKSGRGRKGGVDGGGGLRRRTVRVLVDVEGSGGDGGGEEEKGVVVNLDLIYGKLSRKVSSKEKRARTDQTPSPFLVSALQ